MLVSVVVPMKDEQGSLPLLAVELDGLGASLALRGDDLEVVLVDDGSVDDTFSTASESAAHRSGWSVVKHERNRGFGAGLRSGVAVATGEVVVSYDADCAYPAADVLRLLDAIEAGADVAAATPFADGGTATGSAFRLFVSRSCSLAYRVALGERARGLRTFTCAFRAYRAGTLRRAAWRADGFLAAAEIIALCLQHGAQVSTVSSTLRPRTTGESKMRVMRTTFAHIGLLGRLLARRLLGANAATPSHVTVGEAA